MNNDYAEYGGISYGAELHRSTTAEAKKKRTPRKATKEEIDKNLKLFNEGKPLDIPLRMLGKDFIRRCENG